MKELLPYARKRRQWLRAWAYAHRAVGTERARFLRKLRRLAHAFRAAFTVPQWARVTAALAALALAPNAVEAQVFAAPINAPFNLSAIPNNMFVYPTLVDLDNDGDLDLLGNNGLGSARYAQNTGTPTAPAFGAIQNGAFGLTNLAEVHICAAGDLDNDGDYDLLGAPVDDTYGMFFAYFKNVGTPTAPVFAPKVIDPFGLSASSSIAVYPLGRFVDMDSDGDLDYIALSYQNSGIRYFQNVGTPSSPAFSANVQVNPFNLNASLLAGDISLVEPVDIDLDGDVDLVVATPNNNWIVYENIGTGTSPNFAAPVVNPYGLTSFTPGYLPFLDFADLDNDGDFDLFAMDYEGVAKYYQNNDPNASVEEQTSPVGLAPNPAKDYLFIDFGTPRDWSVVLTNVSGQEVLRTSVQNASCLDVSVNQLPVGVYTVRAQSLSGTQIGSVVIQP